MIIELMVTATAIEDLLSVHHRLDEPVRLTSVEHDELSDLCAFVFEVDEADVPKLDRGWDTDDFASGLVEEAI